MHPIGIVQGRLSPPINRCVQSFPLKTWREEFTLAHKAGLACIEWVYEAGTDEFNPLKTSEGIREIVQLSRTFEVGVWSICADYYMTERLVDREGEPHKKNFQHLEWLIRQASLLKAHHLVIPFVDSSSLRSIKKRSKLILKLLKSATIAEKSGVELHLETDLPPLEFIKFLEGINHSSIRANYDMGNSASLGYNPREELMFLRPWLGSVHVKDRLLGGESVPLGMGATDFPTCFRFIQEMDFNGPFILQAAREERLSEVDLAIKNRKFVEDQLMMIFNGVL